MTQRIVALAVLIVPMHLVYAQKTIYSGARPSPPAGQVIIHPESEGLTGPMDLLIKWSDTIVDGTVTTVLPPVNVNPDIAGDVQTPSLITVNSVLLGKALAGGELVLLERGGKQGKWDVVPAGDPLVQSGERYILFLHTFTGNLPNSDSLIADSQGLSRYKVVGYANGKARIDEGGRIQFAPGATSSMIPYNNVAASSFAATVAGRINFWFPKPVPYPTGATPLKPPPNTIFPTAPMPTPPLPSGQREN